MKAALLTFAVCLISPLSACDVPPPAVVGQSTTLDEKTGIAITVGYTAASRLGNRLARAGLIDSAAFKALDNKGYAAVVALRAAYDAGNATDYATAIAQARAAIEGMQAL